MTRLASRIATGIAVAAAFAVSAPSAASAQDAPPEVTYRQNLMQGIRTNVQQLRAVGDLGHSTHTVHYARALYGLGEMLGDAFREGTPDGSRSLAAVWQDQRSWGERVAAFEMATARLLEASEMRDAAAIQAAMQEVGATCGSCHQNFRASSQ